MLYGCTLVARAFVRALLVRLLVNGRFNEAGETVLSLAAALIAE